MKKIIYRIEHDSLGKVKVPKNALYGAQTQRAIDNFKISGDIFPPEFIESLAALKAACAIANSKSKLLSIKKAKTIYSSAMDIHKKYRKILFSISDRQLSDWLWNQHQYEYE